MGNRSAKKNSALCCLLAALVSQQRDLALLQPASEEFLSWFTAKRLWLALGSPTGYYGAERFNTSEYRCGQFPGNGQRARFPARARVRRWGCGLGWQLSAALPPAAGAPCKGCSVGRRCL